jgi:uncharacterized membrane protein YebE (DUF533 family)
MSFDRILSQLLSSPARAGLAGAVAGGLLTSKAGRKLGKRAVELGGIAAIAGLAYTAWRRYEARAPRRRRRALVWTPARAQRVEAAVSPPPRQEAVGERSRGCCCAR